MTTYHSALLYDSAANFIGRVIMGPEKLQSTNVYKEGEESELFERLEELNAAEDLRQYWPHPQDPEVLELLDRPDFEPIEMHTISVIDIANSPQVVYHEMADPMNPGEWMETDEIDEEASHLAYEDVEVPVRPTDQIHRIRAACETIAKVRAGLTK